MAVAGLQIVESLNAGILVLTAGGDILYCNPRAASVLRRPRAAFFGSNVDAFIPGFKDKLATAGEGRLECGVSLASGVALTIGANITTLEPNHLWGTSGDEHAYLCMFQDITTLRQIQEERDRLLQMAALNAALPSVLHELRNPVAAIATSLEVLVEDAQGELQNDLHALLTEIRRVSLNLQGVGTVVRELRSPKLAPIDECLRNLVRVMEAGAKQKKLTLIDQVQTMPLLPLDTGVVQGLVFNLIHNAIAASKANDKIIISARLDDQQTFLLSVKDQGVGMSEETKLKATELFFTTKERGSGLGLALVKRSVEIAKGRLHFVSEPGVGTEAIIEIPNATLKERTGGPGDPRTMQTEREK